MASHVPSIFYYCYTRFNNVYSTTWPASVKLRKLLNFNSLTKVCILIKAVLLSVKQSSRLKKRLE